MDERVESVLNAIKHGRVNARTIALAGRLIDEGVVEQKYEWIVGSVAAANSDPSPKMRQSVNEILRTALDYSEQHTGQPMPQPLPKPAHHHV